MDRTKIVHEFLSNNPSYIPSSIDLVSTFNDSSIVPNCMAATSSRYYDDDDHGPNESVDEHERQLQIVRMLFDRVVVESDDGDSDVDVVVDRFVNSIGSCCTVFTSQRRRDTTTSPDDYP